MRHLKLFIVAVVGFLSTTVMAACAVAIVDTSSLFATQSTTNRDLLFYPTRCVNGQFPANYMTEALTNYYLWVIAVVPNSALTLTLPDLAQILPSGGFTALRLDHDRGWVFFTEGLSMDSPLPPSRTFPQDNASLITTPGLRVNVKSVEIIRRFDPRIFHGTSFYVAASEKPTLNEAWREIFAYPYSQIDVPIYPDGSTSPLN